MTSRHIAFDEWLSLALFIFGEVLSVCLIIWANWPIETSTGPHGHAHYVRPQAEIGAGK